jgi:hypothetical protein
MDNHGVNTFIKPALKEQTKTHGYHNFGITPPFRTIKARCQDPAIAQEPLH